MLKKTLRRYRLQATAAVYAEYSRRFVCNEEARQAEYDYAEQVKKEKTRNYGYLLLRGSVGDSVREYRQNITKGGEYKGEVEDSEQSSAVACFRAM